MAAVIVQIEIPDDSYAVHLVILRESSQTLGDGHVRIVPKDGTLYRLMLKTEEVGSCSE